MHLVCSICWISLVSSTPYEVEFCLIYQSSIQIIDVSCIKAYRTVSKSHFSVCFLLFESCCTRIFCIMRVCFGRFPCAIIIAWEVCTIFFGFVTIEKFYTIICFCTGSHRVVDTETKCGVFISSTCCYFFALVINMSRSGFICISGELIFFVHFAILIQIYINCFVSNITGCRYYTKISRSTAKASHCFSGCIFQFRKINVKDRSKVICCFCTIQINFQTFVRSIFRILYYFHRTGVLVCRCIFPLFSNFITFEIFYQCFLSGIRCRCWSRSLVALEFNHIYFNGRFLTTSVGCFCCYICLTNFTSDNGCFCTASNDFQDGTLIGRPFQRFACCFLWRYGSFYHHVTTIHNRKGVFRSFQCIRIFRIYFLLLAIFFFNVIVCTLPSGSCSLCDGNLLYRSTNLNCNCSFFLSVLLRCYCDFC